MSKPRTVCVFCGSDRNITKQHVLPNRLRRVAPRQATAHRHTVYTFSRSETEKAILVQPRVRQGHLGTRKLRVVCHNCNTGWIKRIEEAAFDLVESLILGNAPSITATQSSQLAMLSCTIFTMIDLVNLPSSAVSQAERSHIFQLKSPPPTWNLFVGRTDAPEWHMRYRHHAGISLPQGAVPAGHKSNIQVCTATIGKLLLHAVSSQDHLIVTNPQVYADMLGIAELGAGAVEMSALRPLGARGVERVAEKLVSELFKY